MKKTAKFILCFSILLVFVSVSLYFSSRIIDVSGVNEKISSIPIYLIENIKSKFSDKYSVPVSTPAHTADPISVKYYDTVGITSQGTPIVENYSDFRGYKFEITTDSTCFSRIAYRKSTKELFVTFLDSGVSYIYYDVPFYIWDELMEANSKGGYYNSNIKEYYNCVRLQ